MIKDPIYKQATTWTDNGDIQECSVISDHFSKSEEPCFWIEDFSIGLTKQIREAYWYINKNNKNSDYIPGIFVDDVRWTGQNQGLGGRKVTPEQFIEYLTEYFPQHLEWLLWHPGWL